ncbi:hypothetical protein [Arthrobacter sp. B2a2-09]|uniref:hypothetical protein n=1 Tax=Arthrobacter sp. B2a2-09 TaxID=2952822 RepID=UPI0022CDA7BA|nr:hypothetical protein [Arthrobacter sp. B2a2-09]MCZ9881855.1 hypothetical protein [Arthrobacter sp. B2a2-09]
MSYDFYVYASEAAETGRLLELLRSVPGLAPAEDADTDSEPQFLPVVRATTGSYCFTVDGPEQMGADEVPENVTATALAIAYRYDILVEGGDQDSVPLARRFARKLAGALDGVCLDPQTDEQWPKTSLRKAPRPAKDTKIDVVIVYWYYLVQEAPVDLLTRFLQACRVSFPEALPRKYSAGGTKLGTLQANADQAFLDHYENEPLWGLYAEGTFPVFDISFDGREGLTPGQIRNTSMTIDRTTLNDERWRHGLKDLFTRVARESGSFFASAEVARGWSWSGRSLSVNASTAEPAFSCTLPNTWGGLPHYPQWWNWFSTEYLAGVEPYLLGKTEHYAEGTFHSWSPEPLDRDELTKLRPDHTEPWIPEELSYGLDEYRRPGIPAQKMPPKLRQSPQAPETTT